MYWKSWRVLTILLYDILVLIAMHTVLIGNIKFSTCFVCSLQTPSSIVWGYTRRYYLMYAYRICISVIRCSKTNQKAITTDIQNENYMKKLGFPFCLALKLLLLYHMSIFWAPFTSRMWKDVICPGQICKNVTEGQFYISISTCPEIYISNLQHLTSVRSLFQNIYKCLCFLFRFSHTCKYINMPIHIYLFI